MIKTGLVSITFRPLSPGEIIALARETGLAGIEWGGDVHVPHGDLARAREVAARTADSGLAVAAYGSYYRAGGRNDFPFAAVLETALALGAPTIRVWAGEKGIASADADEPYRARVGADLAGIAGDAGDAGLTVSCEFHSGTLTDTNESTRRLLAENGAPALRAYWQPPVGAAVDYCLAGLDLVLPRLTNVHVFHWQDKEKRPLAEGTDRWRRYLARLAAGGGDHYALLEFVRDDDPENLRRDARTLAGLVAEANAA